MLRERLFAVFLGNLLFASLWALFCHRKAMDRSGAAVGGAILAASALPGSLIFAAVVSLVVLPITLKTPPFRCSSKVWAFFAGMSVCMPIAAWGASGARGALPFAEFAALPPAKNQAEVVSEARPDIVLVVADTLRGDAFADDTIPTPHLDALRERGVWTTSALAPSSQTVPSHLTLLLGLDVEAHGMRGNLSPWPSRALLQETSQVKPLATRLHEHGYRTAGIAANALLSMIPEDGQAFHEGFEVWDAMERFDPWRDFLVWKSNATWLGWMVVGPQDMPTKFVNQALRRVLYPDPRRLERYHRDEGVQAEARTHTMLEQLHGLPSPGFLFVNFMDVHAPYLPSKGAVSPEREYWLREHLRSVLKKGASGAEYSLELKGLYGREVSDLDARIGRIWARIVQSGRPTWFVLVGDHGEMFGEHGFVEHGGSNYRAEQEIPFLIAATHRNLDASFSVDPELVDVASTLLALVEGDGAQLHGRDVLHPQAQTRPRLSMRMGGCSLEAEGWKGHFRLHIQDGRTVGELMELFHTAVDPEEARNLLETEPAIAERLSGLLADRLRRDLAPQLEERVLSWGEERLLEGLGYGQAHDHGD